VPGMSGLRRVGHKGADLITPGNTYASFDAAREAGVDMIEFDVLPERGSDRLVLAHDYEHTKNQPAEVHALRIWLLLRPKDFYPIRRLKALGVEPKPYTWQELQAM